MKEGKHDLQNRITRDSVQVATKVKDIGIASETQICNEKTNHRGERR